MSTSSYEFHSDLAGEAAIPARGIHSQTVSERDGVELVLFAMAAGERLSEHTSSRPAVVHVLAGDGELVVAGDDHAISAGSWLSMPARTAHAVTAGVDGLVFALYLMPPG